MEFWHGRSEYRADVGNALISGYLNQMPLNMAEHAALSHLARGACLRFLLTRIYDWINTPAGALVSRKDPLAFLRRLDHYTHRVYRFNDMKSVEIFTDGACKGNPGPGGWGAIIRYGSHEKEISGGDPDTTNNRMEMTAAIRALNVLDRALSKLHLQPTANM